MPRPHLQRKLGQESCKLVRMYTPPPSENHAENSTEKIPKNWYVIHIKYIFFLQGNPKVPDFNEIDACHSPTFVFTRLLAYRPIWVGIMDPSCFTRLSGNILDGTVQLLLSNFYAGEFNMPKCVHRHQFLFAMIAALTPLLANTHIMNCVSPCTNAHLITWRCELILMRYNTLPATHWFLGNRNFQFV